MITNMQQQFFIQNNQINTVQMFQVDYFGIVHRSKRISVQCSTLASVGSRLIARRPIEFLLFGGTFEIKWRKLSKNPKNLSI